MLGLHRVAFDRRLLSRFVWMFPGRCLFDGCLPMYVRWGGSWYSSNRRRGTLLAFSLETKTAKGTGIV